jgi:putative ABC transport system substrate-binding protein
MALAQAVARLAATAFLLAGSVAVQAQQPKPHRIGFLSAASAKPSNPQFEAFRQGLRELGYVEGKNIVVEARFAEGRLERLPALVSELIALKLDVLLAGSPAGAAAAKKAGTTVPIVFAGVGDPVASGIVSSLARPGGNVTGVAVGAGGQAFGEKWVELLREAAPGVSQVAVLANRSNPSNTPTLKGVEAAAKALKVKLDVLDAGTATELDRALAAIGTSGAQAMIVTSDPFLADRRVTLVQFAASKRLPAIYFFKLFADAGGLMSYGASLEESYRRAAAYVDRIVKGAKPADLPVEQPTRFELVINMRTAKVLGMTIPRSLLLRADHVIE